MGNPDSDQRLLIRSSNEGAYQVFRTIIAAIYTLARYIQIVPEQR